MRSHQYLATIGSAVVAAVFLAACGGGSTVGPEHFRLIATEFAGGLRLIDGRLPPAIDESGRVAFMGQIAPTDNRAVFVGDGGPLSVADTQAAGYNGIQAVQLSSGGGVVFLDHARPSGPVPPRVGVYRTDLRGSAYTTLLEEEVHPSAAGFPLRMSGNGTVAFSTINDGRGAVYRGPAAGPVTALRDGTCHVYTDCSATFYNSGQLDVNDAGTAAVQMEYNDGYLYRGILVFDTPGETFPTLEATVQRQDVGVQPALAINNRGQVAFALTTSITIDYFTPPFPTSTGGPPTSSQTFGPGVYLASPAPIGTPIKFTQIASATDGYTSFGDVDVNDAGVVVFEASHGGRRGIFTGNNPAVDKVAITGEPMMIGGRWHYFSSVRLGQLNNRNQVAIRTIALSFPRALGSPADAGLDTDRQIWRIDMPAR